MRNYDISFSINPNNEEFEHSAEFWQKIQNMHFSGDRCKAVAELIRDVLKENGIELAQSGTYLSVKENGGDLTWDQLCDLGGGHPGVRHTMKA